MQVYRVEAKKARGDAFCRWEWVWRERKATRKWNRACRLMEKSFVCVSELEYQLRDAFRSF